MEQVPGSESSSRRNRWIERVLVLAVSRHFMPQWVLHWRRRVEFWGFWLRRWDLIGRGIGVWEIGQLCVGAGCAAEFAGGEVEACRPLMDTRSNGRKAE